MIPVSAWRWVFKKALLFLCIGANGRLFFNAIYTMIQALNATDPRVTDESTRHEEGRRKIDIKCKSRVEQPPEAPVDAEPPRSEQSPTLVSEQSPTSIPEQSPEASISEQHPSTRKCNFIIECFKSVIHKNIVGYAFDYNGDFFCIDDINNANYTKDTERIISSEDHGDKDSVLLHDLIPDVPEREALTDHRTIDTFLELAGIFSDERVFDHSDIQQIESCAQIRRIVASVASVFFAIVSKFRNLFVGMRTLSLAQLRDTFEVEYKETRRWFEEDIPLCSLHDYVIQSFGKDFIGRIANCFDDPSRFNDLEFSEEMIPLIEDVGIDTIRNYMKIIFLENAEVLKYLGDSFMASSWLLIMTISLAQDGNYWRNNVRPNLFLLFSLCHSRAPFKPGEYGEFCNSIIRSVEIIEQNASCHNNCPLDLELFKIRDRSVSFGSLYSICSLIPVGHIFNDLLERFGQDSERMTDISTFAITLCDMLHKSRIFLESVFSNLKSMLGVKTVSARVLFKALIESLTFDCTAFFASSVEKSVEMRLDAIQTCKDVFVSKIHGLMDCLSFEWRGIVSSPLAFDVSVDVTSCFNFLDLRQLMARAFYTIKVANSIDAERLGKICNNHWVIFEHYNFDGQFSPLEYLTFCNPFEETFEGHWEMDIFNVRSWETIVLNDQTRAVLRALNEAYAAVIFSFIQSMFHSEMDEQNFKHKFINAVFVEMEISSLPLLHLEEFETIHFKNLCEHTQRRLKEFVDRRCRFHHIMVKGNVAVICFNDNLGIMFDDRSTSTSEESAHSRSTRRHVNFERFQFRPARYYI